MFNIVIGVFLMEILASDPIDQIEDESFGPHEKIAKTILRVFKNQSGGKGIALEGEFGSGKSTVIELIQHLNTDDHLTFFVFDAWAHQGDHLRRSFLEKLMQKLLNEGWISPESNVDDSDDIDWSEEIQRLGGRKVKQEVNSIPKLSLIGMVAVTLVLLSPIGIALSQLNTPKFKIIGIFLAVMPFLGGLIYSIFKILEQLFCKSKGSKNNRLYFANLISEVERELTKTTYEPQFPSSLEFQNIFQKLLANALNGDKTLVIAIDNLDRIVNKNLIKVWSTLQIFFDVVNDMENSKEQFWLLAPFDPNELSKEAISKDFISKSFDIRFQVPKPTQSNWKRYFIDSMSLAFPQESRSTYLNVYNLYRLEKKNFDHPKQNFTPTPREIKRFINQLLSKHLQWHEEISLEVQALYELKGNRLAENSLRALIEADADLDKIEDTLIGEENWREQLAAIHMGVDVVEARELLIRSPMENAVIQLNAEELQSLYEDVNSFYRSDDLFWDILHDLVEDNFQDWIDNTPSIILELSKMAGEINAGDSNYKSDFWEALSRKALKIERWDMFHEDLAIGLINILGWLESSNKADSRIKRHIKHYIQSLGAKVPDNMGKNFNKKDVANWVDGVIKLCVWIDDGYSSLLYDQFQMIGVPQFQLLAFHYANDHYPEYKNIFVLNLEPESYVTKVAKFCLSDSNNSLFDDSIKILIQKYPEWPWEKFLNYLENQIDNSEEDYLSWIGVLRPVCHLTFLSNDEELKAQGKVILKELISSSKITKILGHVEGTERNDLIALLLFIILRFPKIQDTNIDMNESENLWSKGMRFLDSLSRNPGDFEVLIDKIAGHFEKYKEQGSLQAILSKVSVDNKKFIKSIIDEIN